MIEVRNLRKSFDSLEVLKDINLEIDKGDVISILGSSGSVYRKRRTLSAADR